jgi:hypothetical protein
MAGSIKVQDEQFVEQPKEELMTGDDEHTRRMEKRIVRKLDMTLMPMVWVLYFFNYMDRNNIA